VDIPGKFHRDCSRHSWHIVATIFVWTNERTKECSRWTVLKRAFSDTVDRKQGVALMGRNLTGPPTLCSVAPNHARGRPGGSRPPTRPAHPPALQTTTDNTDRRRRQTTDTSEQNNNGQLGGPASNIITTHRTVLYPEQVGWVGIREKTFIHSIHLCGFCLYILFRKW